MPKLFGRSIAFTLITNKHNQLSMSYNQTYETEIAQSHLLWAIFCGSLTVFAKFKKDR
jgi:hypothetical protein